MPGYFAHTHTRRPAYIYARIYLCCDFDGFQFGEFLLAVAARIREPAVLWDFLAAGYTGIVLAKRG